MRPTLRSILASTALAGGAPEVLSGSDQVGIQRLKKQKLALKDRIAHLESDSIPDIIA